MAHTTTKPNGHLPTPPAETNNGAPTINRKKQKRREKLAAKLAAEQPLKNLTNGAQATPGSLRRMQDVDARFRDNGLDGQYNENGQFDPPEEYYNSEDQDDEYSGSYGRDGSSANGYAISTINSPGTKSKKKKSTSKAAMSDVPHHTHHATNGLSHDHVSLPLPPLAPTNIPRGPGISKEKIWNTSSQEERERIKEFWLSLGEDERKSLVKVEKDAVLKKMKEQQKHSCSCTVCGRKRTAIEEELEVLYDAYYEELEQYAHHQGPAVPPILPSSRRFGAMSGLQPPHRLPPSFNQQPSRGRIVEQLGDDDDEDGDEDYSDEGDEEDLSDEEEPEEIPRNNHAADFFSFGNSLTVQGGILTVADDLLKNDGKKFIEMMEQLAERRMAREEDAKEQYSNQNYGHPPNGAMHSHSHVHNHPPPPDDEGDYEDDEEDDEGDYDDSQDEDYDEEEMVGEGQCGCVACSNFIQDTMTEEQRMEEGRRMFQIFAARMFEQRVLTAYKEKVAKERQQKLLEELEDEDRANSQKKAKKAKDAQKKKDKLAQKKQALAEEKARRESEKAAEEAALRAAEEKKIQEQKLRAEEKRKKKEAQKKAEEEERSRKEAEKQRRLQEQRERQAELERKQREAKEKERKEREELRQKERDAKESKDREAKERREKQERDKREKELKAKADREAREKQKRDDIAAQQAAVQAAHTATMAAKRQPPVPIPATLQSHVAPIASPHVPVATPAIPKAPTPIKLRTSSQQDSNSSIPQTPQSSALSQNASPVPSTPLQGSPGPIGPPGKNPTQHPFIHQPQATSPIHSALKSPPGMQANPFGGMPMGMGFQPGMPMMAPGFERMHHNPMFPHQQPLGGPFRPLAGPNGMPIHPGMNMHQMPQGRGFPLPHGPPGFPNMPNGLGGIGQLFGPPKDAPPIQSHSRQPSASYEKPFDNLNGGPQAQPIARPAPIGRPPSVVHGHRKEAGNTDMEDLTNQLGSSALLDDSDEQPINPGFVGRRSSALSNLNSRPNFPPMPFGMEPTFGSPIHPYNTWGAPPNPFGPSSLPGSSFSGGWGPVLNGSFGSAAPMVRPSQPRSVAVRLMICRACKNIEGTSPDGFNDINVIKEQIDHFNPGNEPISEKEVLDICETEGNSINGGGSFDIRRDDNGCFIRHNAENENTSAHRPVGPPGEIGSPIVSNDRTPRFPGPPPGL
jgi:hypothetical protein